MDRPTGGERLPSVPSFAANSGSCLGRGSTFRIFGFLGFSGFTFGEAFFSGFFASYISTTILLPTRRSRTSRVGAFSNENTKFPALFKADGLIRPAGKLRFRRSTFISALRSKVTVTRRPSTFTVYSTRRSQSNTMRVNPLFLPTRTLRALAPTASLVASTLSCERTEDELVMMNKTTSAAQNVEPRHLTEHLLDMDE